MYGCFLVQVLVRTNDCDLSWRDTSGGTVPVRAVKGGHTGDQEDLYICRATAGPDKAE